MEEKDYQPVILPEEGFVPYCGSDEAQTLEKKKPQLYFVILGILGILAVGGFLFLLIGRSFNFYYSSLNSLRFDYREGETISEDALLQKGACAADVSAAIGKQQITVDIVMYLLDEKRTISEGISGYHYLHSTQTDELTVRSGTKSWPFTEKTVITLPLQNGNPPVTEEYKKPLLYELMFGSRSHDAYVYTCYDAYDSDVDGKQYICEIWLMEDHSLETTSYYTLYRYYQDGRLAGLRVLSDRDPLMEVYDIQDYRF